MIYTIEESTVKSLADQVRRLTNTTDSLTTEEMSVMLESVTAGGGSGGGNVEEKDVIFIDYDGTILYSYTVEETQALTELPPLPSHDGLICQGWNFDLETIKEYNHGVVVGAMYITDDGTTRIYIELQEGRTSPMLGVCPDGTVTVDWGDGTEHDVLTGTSEQTIVWTQNHEYSMPGSYIIRLTVNGKMGIMGEVEDKKGSCILRYSSTEDNRNIVYETAVKKVEVGNNVRWISHYAFYHCSSLKSISMPNSVTYIGVYAFFNCYNLQSVTIPNGVTGILGYAFYRCYSLQSISMPNSVTKINYFSFQNCPLQSVIIPNKVTAIGQYAFSDCNRLHSVVIPDGVTSIGDYAFSCCRALTSIFIPDSVTRLGSYMFWQCDSLRFIAMSSELTGISNNAFQLCYSLESVTIPNGVTYIYAFAFEGCSNLQSITIPDTVTIIHDCAFQSCKSLASITIPSSVTQINSGAFSGCVGVRFYDFTKHSAVPTLKNTNAFNYNPSDMEIRVPAALYDEWIAATNWSTYANQIVAV